MDTFEAVQKRYRESIALRRAEVKEKAAAVELEKKGSPGERLSAAMSLAKETEIRAARDRKPEPEQTPRILEAKPQEAERMAYQPTGLQRGPSPGGNSYVNPRAYRPTGEGLIDQIERQRAATREAAPPEQRQNQAPSNEVTRRPIDRDR